MGKSPVTPTSARAAEGRLLREDPLAEVGEDVGVGVSVSVTVDPMEFQLNRASSTVVSGTPLRAQSLQLFLHVGVRARSSSQDHFSRISSIFQRQVVI